MSLDVGSENTDAIPSLVLPQVAFQSCHSQQDILSKQEPRGIFLPEQ